MEARMILNMTGLGPLGVGRISVCYQISNIKHIRISANWALLQFVECVGTMSSWYILVC